MNLTPNQSKKSNGLRIFNRLCGLIKPGFGLARWPFFWSDKRRKALASCQLTKKASHCRGAALCDLLCWRALCVAGLRPGNGRTGDFCECNQARFCAIGMCHKSFYVDPLHQSNYLYLLFLCVLWLHWCGASGWLVYLLAWLANPGSHQGRSPCLFLVAE